MAATTAQPQTSARLRDPTYLAFVILWVGFTVAPLLFGLDKFFNVMVDWSDYLWPQVDRALPSPPTGS